MVFCQIKEYIETIWSIYHVIKEKAKQQNDKKLEMIALVIYNYISYMCKTHRLKFEELRKEQEIGLKYFFDYLNNENIQLFDLNSIKIDDVDITNKAHIEQFVLSHIYYFMFENSK